MSGVTSLQDYGGVRSMLALSENIIITGSYDGSLFICSLDLLSKKYNINYLDFNYNNCNYQDKNKENKTIEVLITNY